MLQLPRFNDLYVRRPKIDETPRSPERDPAAREDGEAACIRGEFCVQALLRQLEIQVR